MDGVKSIERMLTAEEVAELVRKPVRWVRENLLKTGVLRGRRFGGNCWRVTREDYLEFERRGSTGFRFARSSGGARGKGRVAV